MREVFINRSDIVVLFKVFEVETCNKFRREIMKGNYRLRIGIVMAVLLLLILSSTVSGSWREKLDLGGRTVTIATYNTHLLDKYFSDGLGRGRLELVEDMFNVNIEFYDLTWDGAIDTIMASIMAGDPVGDIFSFPNHWLIQLASQGALYPLDDILGDDYYASLPGMHSNMRELYSTFQGRAYGFSTNDELERDNDVRSGHVMYWNKDMFESAGLPSLYELMDEGEWTWDKMLEIAKALTKDTDGDGEIDQWGLDIRWGPADFLEILVLTNDGSYIREIDGKMCYTATEDKVLEAIEFLHDLIYVHKVVGPKNSFGKGQAAMGRFAFANMNAKLSFNRGVAYWPQGPQADKHVLPLWGPRLAALPVMVKEPAAMIAIVNALFEVTDEYRDLDTYEEEILERYLPYFHDYESLEVMGDMIDKGVMTMVLPGAYEIGFTEALTSAIDGTMSPAAAMDAIAPAMQQLIDDIYN